MRGSAPLCVQQGEKNLQMPKARKAHTALCQRNCMARRMVAPPSYPILLAHRFWPRIWHRRSAEDTLPRRILLTQKQCGQTKKQIINRNCAVTHQQVLVTVPNDHCRFFCLASKKVRSQGWKTGDSSAIVAEVLTTWPEALQQACHVQSTIKQQLEH